MVSLWVTGHKVFSFFQLTTVFTKCVLRYLWEINSGNRDGAGSKICNHTQWEGGIHKKLALWKFIRGINLSSQAIQWLQKVNNLTYAANRLRENSYIYTPWAVVTTWIHKATEHSGHFKLPKALQILTNDTDRSYSTYRALRLWTGSTLWSSQLGKVTTPSPPGSHVTGDRNVLLWGLVATLIKGLFFNTKATMMVIFDRTYPPKN